MQTLLCLFRQVRKHSVLIVIVAVLISACTSTSSSTTSSTPTSEATSQPGIVKTLAEDIVTDVGKVMDAVDGTSDQTVIVFEETHDSIAGQIEIAVMMNRLYENYGLRQIGLEGYFNEKGKLDTSWLPPSSFKAKGPITPREDTVAQLLREGEISSSEMMALIYDDLTVTGIETSEEYNYEPSDKAWSAPTIYLYLIAAPGMSQDEIGKANELIEAEKTMEAIEYIISTDDWTSQKYASMNDESKIISAESWLQILDDIEAKAAEAKAEISAEDKQAMQDLHEFYERASQRSRTMVDNTLALSESSSKVPVAMVIGAAHTELIAQLLKEKGVSFAVIRSNSLAEKQENGDLSSQAYERKTKQLSVDKPGALGALLDNRKKPQPVISKEWFQKKSETYFIIDTLARAAAGGEKPPFDKTLDKLSKLKWIKIDKAAIKLVDDNLILSITTPDDNGKDVTIWVRAKADKKAADQLLEQRLLDERDDTQKEDKPSNEEEGKADSELPLIPISSNTVAEFSTDKAIIEKSKI